MFRAGPGRQEDRPPLSSFERKSRVEDEKAVRAADTAWSKAASTKNLEKTLSFYADNAVVLAPGMQTLSGKQAIRNFWETEFKNPAHQLDWSPVVVEVAASGDLGYSRGTYRERYAGPDGNVVNETGKYVIIWKRRRPANDPLGLRDSDGVWKAAVDTFNADPAPAPAKH